MYVNCFLIFLILILIQFYLRYLFYLHLIYLKNSKRSDVFKQKTIYNAHAPTHSVLIVFNMFCYRTYCNSTNVYCIWWHKTERNWQVPCKLFKEVHLYPIMRPTTKAVLKKFCYKNIFQYMVKWRGFLVIKESNFKVTYGIEY